jgi:L-alanine-DL-glutamate epimerase-like enolase superfamily enzyme
MGTLDLANLHVACAIGTSKYIELFQPGDVWSFPQIDALTLDPAGNAVAPDGPGIGMAVDWDYVDDTTRTAHVYRQLKRSVAAN